MTKFFRTNDDSPDDEELEEEIKTMYPGFVYRVSDSPALPQVPMHIVVPFLGRLRFVRDWNGVLLLAFVVLCFMYSIFTTTFIIILPQYQDGNLSGPFALFYGFLNVMCLLTLLNVSTMNPGEVTSQDTDDYKDPAVSSYCKTCHLNRPPRGYHCVKCGHCVRRMDYHYTWLNNCVGADNHHLLLLFLVYTFLLCLTTLTLVMFHLYKFPKCISCDRFTIDIDVCNMALGICQIFHRLLRRQKTAARFFHRHEAFYIKHSIWLVYIQNILCVIIGFQTFVSIVVQHLNIIMNRTILENIFLSPVYDVQRARRKGGGVSITGKTIHS